MKVSENGLINITDLMRTLRQCKKAGFKHLHGSVDLVAPNGLFVENKDIAEIIKHWNSHIVPSTKTTNNLKLQIQICLNQYTKEAIMSAIDNYKMVKINENCWLFNSSWKALLFFNLKKDYKVRDFLPMNFELSKFYTYEARTKEASAVKLKKIKELLK